MNLEEQLIKRFGKERHFNVPTNYFDDLTHNIMRQIPQETTTKNTQHNIFYRVRPFVFAAASVAALFVMAGAYYHVGENRQIPTVLQQASNKYGHDAIDQAVDYMMIDTDDMYAYISDI